MGPETGHHPGKIALKLQTRILLLISLTAIIVGLASAAITSRLMTDHLEAAQIKHATTLVRALKGTLALQTINRQFLQSRDHLRKIVQENTETTFAFIVGFDGHVFSHTFDDRFPLILASALKHDDPPDHHGTTIKRFTTNDGPLLIVGHHLIEGMNGHIFIGIDQTPLFRKVDRARWRIVILTLGVTLIGILLAHVFNRGLNRPITRLVDSLHAFAKGKKVDLEFPTGGYPELDTVKKAFDTTVKERQAIEEELRSANRRFSSVMDGLDALVYVADMETHEMLFLNRYGQAVWGDHRGKTCWQFLQSGQDGPCPFCNNHLLLDADGKPAGVQSWEFQNTITNRWYLCRDQAIHWPDGRMVRMEIATDITDLKHLEASLREAREEAEESNLAKSEFLAAMSHELRTPMNAIIGMGEVLSETELDGEQTQYVQVLQRSTDALLGLIDDLLDLSKVEARQVTLNPVSFDLYDLVTGTTEILAQRAREKGITLETRIRPATPHVVIGDPRRLRQLLINLLSNAVKFTNHGRIDVLVEPVDIREGTILLRFQVADTGIGIPAKKLKMIFDCFTQGNSSNSRVHGGTGLGLAICRRLVELMDGEIRVESQPGQGSVFEFTARFGQPPGRGDLPPPRELAGTNLLIVDDATSNRRELGELLEGMGCRSRWMTDPFASLEELERALTAGDPYQALLVAAELPGMDGFRLAGEIRKNPLLASLPVVIIGADDRENARTEARGLNAGYLLKPISGDTLLATLRQSLSDRPDNGPETNRSSLDILLAEDVEDNAMLIQLYLKGSGHRLEMVKNGAQAVTRFKEQPFDLVLMDLQMPIMDGYTATREIRRWEREQQRKPVPILALTAFALSEDIEKSLAAGCNDHFGKPIRKESLLKTLNHYAGQPHSG